MKKISTIFLSLSLLLILNLPLASAQLLNTNTTADMNILSDHTANSFDSKTDKTTMTQIIADVIKVFLGLLGVIFVIIIIVAGFNWMMAGGNEEKVEKAKHLISRATIGLLIIIAAYAITYFVFSRLPSGTDTGI